MKLKWDTTFTTYDGKPYYNTPKDDEDPRPITLKDAVLMALDWQSQKTTAETKYKRYEIIKKVADDAELTLDDVVTIREAVSDQAFLPFIYGQIVDILDQKEVNLKVVTKGEANG